MFLLSLNCLTSANTIGERKFFVMPLLGQDTFGDEHKISVKIHHVLNSYPQLDALFVPFAKALFVIHVKSCVLIVYIDSSLQKEYLKECKKMQQAVVMALSQEMFHYDKDWRNSEIRPLTEGFNLGSYKHAYAYLDDMRSKTFITDSIKRNKKNHHCFFIEAGNDINFTKCKILLIVFNALLGESNLRVNCNWHTIQFHNFAHDGIAIIPKVLSSLVNSIFSSVSNEEALFDQVYDPTYRADETANTIWCKIHDEEDTKKVDMGITRYGSIPKTFPNIYQESYIYDNINCEKFLDLEIVNFGIRALLHFNPDKLFRLHHIMVSSDELINVLYHLGNCNSNVPMYPIHSEFRAFVGAPLGFILPNPSVDVHHIVCARVVILKSESGCKKPYTLHGTIYDSWCGDKTDLNTFPYHEGDQESVSNYDKAELKQLKALYNDLIVKSILPKLLETLTEPFTGDKINKDEIWVVKKNVTISQSVFSQRILDDTSCGINSYLCFLCLMMNKTEDHWDGIRKQILQKWDNFISYRYFFTQLIFATVGHYLIQLDISLFRKDTEEDLGKLVDSEEFKAMYTQWGNVKEKDPSTNHILPVSQVLSKLSDILGDDIAMLFSFLDPNNSKQQSEINDNNGEFLFSCIRYLTSWYLLKHPNISRTLNSTYSNPCSCRIINFWLCPGQKYRYSLISSWLSNGLG